MTDDTSSRIPPRARDIIDAGGEIMGKPPSGREIAFMHSVLCRIGLPRSAVQGREFTREWGTGALSVQAGKLWDGKKLVDQPVPYGPLPRLMLSHIATHAIRHETPEIENRGNVIEALAAERAAVMALPVNRIELNLTQPVQHYMELRGALSSRIEKTIRQEATRMALLIEQRVKSGGELSVRVNPLRTAPNVSDTTLLLIRKWTVEQGGKCALCKGPLIPTKHRMLQPSPDRIDSGNGAYDDANLQVAHLACNWAKNQYGSDAFDDWLGIVRDVQALEMDAEEPDMPS